MIAADRDSRGIGDAVAIDVLAAAILDGDAIRDAVDMLNAAIGDARAARRARHELIAARDRRIAVGGAGIDVLEAAGCNDRSGGLAARANVLPRAGVDGGAVGHAIGVHLLVAVQHGVGDGPVGNDLIAAGRDGRGIGDSAEVDVTDGVNIRRGGRTRRAGILDAALPIVVPADVPTSYSVPPAIEMKSIALPPRN